MDWPGAYWGMYYFGNYSPSDRKLAYFEFQNLTNCNPLSVAENPNEEKPTLLFDASTENYILNIPGSNEKSKIEIWNSLGEKFLQMENKSSSLVISKNSLDVNSGIYFMRVERMSKASVFKLIF